MHQLQIQFKPVYVHFEWPYLFAFSTLQNEAAVSYTIIAGDPICC